MENVKREMVKDLAINLYFDLPFWKRWSIRKWFHKNNDDVGNQFKECFDVAMSMDAFLNYWYYKRTGTPMSKREEEEK